MLDELQALVKEWVLAAQGLQDQEGKEWLYACAFALNAVLKKDKR